MSPCLECLVVPADHIVADECERCDGAADEAGRVTAGAGLGGAGVEAGGDLAGPFTSPSTATPPSNPRRDA